MFPIHSHEAVRATLDERLRRAPQRGIRRSARLISLEIRRSRHPEQGRHSR